MIRAALLASSLALSGCALPYFTSSHDDPADGAWVVVVGSSEGRVAPLLYRMDGGAPVAVLPELVAAVDDGPGFGQAWLPSPDGKRFAFEEHYPGGVHWMQRTRVVATDGPPWTFVDLPDVGTPLAWSPDGARLACLVAERIDDKTWRRGLAVVDVATGAVRRYDDLPRRPNVECSQVAFSPDGMRLAFPRDGWRIALLDLATGEVVDPALPEAGASSWLLGWLRDGRIAYSVGRRVLFARPGDATPTVFPTDMEDDYPVSARPDGGAVLVGVERTPMISMYKRRGALVVYADGGREDLDFVKGFQWSFHGDIAVWFPAPGPRGEPVR